MSRSSYKPVWFLSQNYKLLNKKTITLKRNSDITWFLLDQEFRVHNGRFFGRLRVSSDMFGMKAGAFYATRAISPVSYKQKSEKRMHLDMKQPVKKSYKKGHDRFNKNIKKRSKK